jgi:hypothetical protein
MKNCLSIIFNNNSDRKYPVTIPTKLSTKKLISLINDRITDKIKIIKKTRNIC